MRAALALAIAAACGGSAGGPSETAFVVLNGCQQGDYAEGSSTIKFGMVFYAPRCLVVSPGQTVMFDGSASGSGFDMHALQPGVAPGVRSDGPGSEGNPIQPTLVGSTASFSFSRRGLFPYYCRAHDSAMNGVVWVR